MKTVIEMAREAEIGDSHGHMIRNELSNLKRFAELVRADAIADEREACATVCDDAFVNSHAGKVICNNLAAAIRARSNQ